MPPSLRLAQRAPRKCFFSFYLLFPHASLEPDEKLLRNSLFYVDEEGESSAEIDWPDVAALVEAGVIGDETLVYSDQHFFEYDEWVPFERCRHCFED